MKLLNTLLLGLLAGFSLQAQSLQPGLLSTAGGFVTTSSGSLQWTLGEIAVQTLSSGDQQLTQGLQQNGMMLTPVFETGQSALYIEVFPNPTVQQILVQRKAEYLPEQSFTLQNMLGQTQLSGTLRDELTAIELNTLAAQIYILRIFSPAGRQLAVFKIQKID